MKTSLLCLILALDLEDHNVIEMLKTYRGFGAEISDHHLHLIVQRGITIALHDGGLARVKSFWEEIQVIITPMYSFFKTRTRFQLETSSIL